MAEIITMAQEAMRDKGMRDAQALAAQAVSLWDICHTTTPLQAKPYMAPQGARGLYQEGECCVWEGQIWRSTVSNNAYSPADYPANLDTNEEE